MIGLGYYGGIHYFSSMVLAIYLLFNLLFRKGHQGLSHKIGGVSEAALSPITGMVREVAAIESHPLFGNNLVRVSIQKGWFDAANLFVPLTSEVSNRHIVERQTATPEVGEVLIFRCPQGTKVGLHLLRSRFGYFAKNWLEIGDRGERGANFGFFPFRGTVLLYLPNSYRILVSEGEKIFGDETAIAVPPASNNREKE
ncbi:MAG: hypothetical protein HN353_04295 [Bdellovibrionales bacterium]|nr:hypothetical protein [Bdellovibrionales bacterium]MBT3526496.1 hypothetical protein [Bdellovibrionales bacterium]